MLNEIVFKSIDKCLSIFTTHAVGKKWVLLSPNSDNVITQIAIGHLATGEATEIH